MTKLISFDVQDAQLIDEVENSHFATAKIQAFSSGLNRHDMNCSEDVLKKTAETIYEKPLLYTIDEKFRDFWTHVDLDKNLIAGFVVPGSAEFERLEDGRLTLTVMAKIWKKYSAKFLNLFKESDENRKKISVEMELTEADEKPNGITEMLNFVYAGVTILGDLITEASPGANMQMLSFSKENEEYKEVYELEFGKFDDLNFTIPSSVKSAAKSGLELRQKFGRGGTSVGLATARYLVNNKVATPEKVRHIAKYFPRHAGDNLDDKESNGWIAWQLWGGDSGRRWSTSLVKKMNEIEEKKLSYFSDGNEIDQKTDSMTLGENKEENKEKMSMEDEEKKVEEMATESPVPEKEEKEQDMAAPPPEEEKETKEKEETEDEDMSAFANFSEIFALLGDEAKEMAVKFESEKKVDLSALCNAMFAKMAKMKEDNDAYMAENSDLKKFKADMEMAQYNAKVMATLGEVQESMPADKFAEVKDDSANFSLDSFDAWRNKTLAIAFAYTKDMKNDDGITRMSLSFTLPANKPAKGSVWEEIK